MKIEGFQARINQNGRIVIPAVIRKAAGLALGDVVVMSFEDGVLRIEPQKPLVRRAQEIPRHPTPRNDRSAEQLAPGPSEESRSESEEWLG